MTLAHLTLNTGHVRQSPRAEVAEAVIRFLDPLIRAGGGKVPSGCDDLELSFALTPSRERCQIELALATPGAKPYVLAEVAWSEEAARESWSAMHDLADSIGLQISGERPQTVPSLIALLTPQAANVPPQALAATGDLERCLAWAILAQEGLA